MNFSKICKCLLSLNLYKFIFSYDYNQMLILKVFLSKILKRNFINEIISKFHKYFLNILFQFLDY